MKLIVQIPCFNEEATLKQTIQEIPRVIKGIDSVEVLVIDDGSSDRTLEVARQAGADHIICHTRNKGLAATFTTGLMESLRLEADIIVNTDGDNQYPGNKIPELIQPIIEGSADITVGDRETRKLQHFSKTKRILQKLGSWGVRKLSGVEVADAVSGFRALSKDAAININIVSKFSYTIEMLIQAGEKKLAIQSVVTGSKKTDRSSRLFKSVPQFLFLSGVTAVRVYTMYRPLRVFSKLGLFFILVGIVPIARFLFLYLNGDGDGHIQSIIIGSILIVIGCFVVIAGVLADLIGFNRKLLEQILILERKRSLTMDFKEKYHDKKNEENDD